MLFCLSPEVPSEIERNGKAQLNPDGCENDAIHHTFIATTLGANTSLLQMILRSTRT
jgi:hypothetical protein